MMARPPKNVAPMLPRGPYAGAVPVNELLRNAADRADTDTVDAQRGAEAVLETLAQRIGGQADDLTTFSAGTAARRVEARTCPPRPGPDRRSIPRPDRRPGPREPGAGTRSWPRRCSPRFRQTVPSEEYFDVTVQLPPRYWELLGRADPAFKLDRRDTRQGRGCGASNHPIVRRRSGRRRRRCRPGRCGAPNPIRSCRSR